MAVAAVSDCRGTGWAGVFGGLGRECPNLVQTISPAPNGPAGTYGHGPCEPQPQPAPPGLPTYRSAPPSAPAPARPVCFFTGADGRHCSSDLRDTNTERIPAADFFLSFSARLLATRHTTNMTQIALNAPSPHRPTKNNRHN